MGFIVLILLYQCLRTMHKDEWSYIILALMAFVLDFNVFCLSREAITVLPCMLATTFLLWGMLKIGDIRIKYFFLGAWPVLAFCIVYMYLTFLIVASVAYMAIEILFEKEYRRNKVAFYVIGILTGLFISELCSLLFFQQHITKTIADTLFAHHGKIGGISFISRGLIDTFLTVFAIYLSNVFKYNPFLLFVSFFSIMICAYLAVTRRDKKAFAVFLLFAIHWGQTIFLNNMTESKAATTFPPLIVMVSYSFSCLNVEQMKKNLRLYTLFIMFASFSICLSVFIVLYQGRANMQFVLHTRGLMAWYFVAFVGAVATVLFFIFDMKKKILLPAYCVTLLFLVALSVDKILIKRTYQLKDTLTGINSITKGTPVINGISIALYNSSESPTDGYDHYKGVGYDYDYYQSKVREAVEKYDELYFVSNKGDIQETNETIAETSYKFVLEKKFERDYFWSYPESHDSDFFLFKKKTKVEP